MSLALPVLPFRHEGMHGERKRPGQQDRARRPPGGGHRLRTTVMFTAGRAAAPGGR